RRRPGRSASTPGTEGPSCYLATIPRERSGSARDAARSAGEEARAAGMDREGAVSRMRDAVRAALAAAGEEEEEEEEDDGGSSEAAESDEGTDGPGPPAADVPPLPP
ncbi:hypothetical protein THAOC_03760, partial [Thalassiosira oceanica]